MKLPTYALFLAVSLQLTAADWPQFRGASANALGGDAGLPARLDAKNITWAIDLPGRGLSSPIIVGDRLFVTCSSGPKQERLHVICLNALSGAKLWERQFWATGRTISHEKTCVAAPTPASDGKLVFAVFSSNDLVCLDLDGNLQWLRGLMSDYPNAGNSLGMSSSLIVADGALVVMSENDSDSFTAGIDVRTGVNRWKLERPKMANWTSPALLNDAAGKTQVLLQSGKGLAAIDPASGRTVWNFAGGASTIPSSTVADGIVFVPSGGITALEPSADGSAPKQLWKSGQLSPATASPVVLNKRIYTINNAGVLTCGDAVTGNRLWQLRMKGSFSATPVASGNFLYCVNEKGVLQVVDTTAPEGAITSELDFGKTVLGTPSIAHKSLYVRADGKIWKVGANEALLR